MLDEKLLNAVWTDLENPNKIEFKTGFIDLDVLIELKKGAVVTIGARPAMGKTTFMFNIIEYLMKNKQKAVLFSLDLSKVQAARKLLFQNAEIEYYKYRSHELKSNDWEKLANSIKAMSEWNLDIFDEQGLTIEKIEEVVKTQKPDAVFLDYVQLISGNRKKDRFSQIEDFYLGLKKIAKEYGTIIFVTSQLSRAVENRCDKRPLLSDLRDSGSIENISDVVIFLYRPEYYYPKENDIEMRGKTDVIVAKNKLGCLGDVNLQFKSNIPKFYNIGDNFDIL